MVKNNYGRIINIASMYNLVGSMTAGIGYHSSKGGIINPTIAAAELTEYNLTVNAIAPRFFEYKMTCELIKTDSFKEMLSQNCPKVCLGNQGELDSVLIYLASDEASYSTRSVVVVDGGTTAI
jgi:gluconate 5-dehydrogenase